MRTPQLDDGTAKQYRRALQEVSEQDALDMLESSTSFDNHCGSHAVKCFNRLWVMIHNYEIELSRYEDKLNDIQELYEQALIK